MDAVNGHSKCLPLFFVYSKLRYQNKQAKNKHKLPKVEKDNKMKQTKKLRKITETVLNCPNYPGHEKNILNYVSEV